MNTTFSTNGQRHTIILSYETKPKTFLKDSGIFMRQGEVTKPETLQAT